MTDVGSRLNDVDSGFDDVDSGFDDVDSKYDNIDVDAILARVRNRQPFNISKRCLYQAPEFTQRLPAYETVEEGSTVTFGCKVLGFPKPTVTWYKDDDVIAPESRAELTTEDNGVYSIKLQDVSKCDAGTYRISATNLEGSSSSSLCISVKGRFITRKKKKKARTVACAPLFPAIVEHEAEERRETLAAESQDDSPLTPLYSSISRKSPVTWPAFLGDWAYNREDVGNHELDDLEIECEDVFDEDTDHPEQPSLTFVSSAHTQAATGATPDNKVAPDNKTRSHIDDTGAATDNKRAPDNKIHSHIDDTVLAMNKTNVEHTRNAIIVNEAVATSDEIMKLNKSDPEGIQTHVKQSCDVKPPTSLNLSHTVIDSNIRLTRENDIINNNEDNNTNSTSTNEKCNGSTDASSDFKVPPKQIEDETIHYDASEVSQISVNRSYAKGNSTFSVATRSSPYRSARSRSASPCNGCAARPDTSTLQNLNNERLWRRMRQSEQWSITSCITAALHWTDNAEDHLAELFMLLCGCTFLALFFDLSPATFMFNIIMAMLVKLAVNFVFKRL